MAKRKRRSPAPDELDSWREQMAHGHVAGYWASVGRFPPQATIRASTGCIMVFMGSLMIVMMIVIGILGVFSANSASLLSALGGMIIGAFLLWLGMHLLRRSRQKHR